MKMKLWVLKADLVSDIYLTPENKYTNHLSLALKFETEKAAVVYKKHNEQSLIINFEAVLVEIEFKE